MPETVTELRTELRRHIDQCEAQGRANGLKMDALQNGHANIAAKLDALNATAWKAAGALLLMLIPAIAWMMLQIWPVQGRIATKQDVAVHTANRYTAQDAQRDRMQQNAVNDAIMERLDQLSKRRR